MTLRFVLTVAALLGAPGPALAARYTLAQLVKKVTEEHPGVVAERAMVAMRRAQLLEQQLRWTPEGEARFLATGAPEVRCLDEPLGPDPLKSSQLNPDEVARRNNCLRTTVVDLLRSAPGRTLGDRAPIHGPLLMFNAQLRQPIYTFGKIESAIQAAKGGIAYQSGLTDAATLDLAVGAVRVYAQLKAAREAVQAVTGALARMAAWRDEVNDELEGPGSRFTEADLLRIRVHLVNMAAWEREHRRNVKAAHEALKALTGDPAADLEDDDEPLELKGVPREVDAWLARMRADRPELKWADGGMHYYRAWQRLHLTFALPDIALVSGIGWGASPTFDLPTLGYGSLPASALGGGFVFALRQPLDLGQKVVRWDGIRHEARMQAARLRLGLAFWSFETRKAHLDFLEALGRLEALDRVMRVTRGWYAAVDQNLAIGVYTDGRELIEVMLNRLHFDIRRAYAEQDALIALAVLRRMSGQPIVGGTP